MGKKNQIQDSPEYKYFEENFDALMSEMEQDKKSEKFEIPDEWDQEFRKVIKERIKKNEGQREKRRKGFLKVVGIVTAAMFVLLVGNFTVEQVNGEGLLEIFQNSFILGDKQHTMYGTNNEIEFDTDNDSSYIYFSGTTLEEVCDQIRKEIKCPIFSLGYIPEGFVVEDATYEKTYRMINIRLAKGKDYIYIYQQKQIGDTSFGFVEEEKRENTLLNNDKLNMQIQIYEGYQDHSWSFNIMKNNDVLSVDASISKEEFIKIAENVEYL
ncbi:MAG: DUF4367 domain-containing protein [Oliverpabstia sp.]